MEHTKGKWKIKGTFINNNTGYPIAQVWPDTKLSSAKSVELMEGNARLIAAAPIMYSFLRKRASHGDIEAKQIISKVTLD